MRILRTLLASHVFLACVLPAVAQANHPWTIQEIFGGDSLTGHPPDGISWSPDGKRATYIDESGNMMQVRVADGKLTTLIAEPKIAHLLHAPISEKDADHRSRYGEPDYTWSPDSQHVLFDTNGQLWLFDIANSSSSKGTQVGDTGMQSGDDPKFSPDGTHLSYVRHHNLYVQQVANPAAPVQLTHDTLDTLTNGEIDWVYLEELEVRSNYFWSPDSKQLAFLQMDESKVPLYPITDWIPTHAVIDQQRYPQPGDPNPGVRVGIVDAAGGETRWINLPIRNGDDYIPRFGWIDANTVWIETLTRDQKHKDLYFADSRSGRVRKVLEQTEPKYFGTTYDVAFLHDHQFVLQSWRDGYTHLYRYGYDGEHPLASGATLRNQLESGPYEASKIGTIDEDAGTVYYLSNEGNPPETQVWAVQLDGSGKHRVTRAAGVHRPDFPYKGSSFIDTASSGLEPPSVSYCTSNGDCTSFWKSHPVTGHTITPPVSLELTAADGSTRLYGTLQLPQGVTERAGVPLLVNPYGGPDASMAKNAWKGKTLYLDQLLAEHGFAVLHVDNRGMGGRGRDFEQVAYHSFGPTELADQLAAVDQVLAKYPQLDGHRMGWWGWSWGGTFTLYALSHSDRFLAGSSGAPVTDWRNYDSIYTERYLGLPEEDAQAYRENSVVNSAENLKGHLLLFHGTGDDNVHLANTIQYIQKLIDAGIPYDYNIFPRKTHSVSGAKTQTELYNRLLAQFEMYVKNKQP